MDEQLIQRSASAGISSCYGAYCLGRLASSSDEDSQAAFTLPDYEDDAGSGEDSAASGYDLASHLRSDRTTYLKDSGTAVETPEISIFSQRCGSWQDSGECLEAEETYATDSLCSVRAITDAVPSGTITGTDTEERASAKMESFAATPHDFAGTNISETSYPAESVDLTQLNKFPGTFPATTASENMRADKSESIHTGNSQASVMERPAGSSYSASDGDRNDRQNESARQNQQSRTLDLTSLAGAASVEDVSSQPGAFIASDQVKMPRMKEISKAILDQMERMRNDTQRNSVSMTLDLEDGSSVELRLRWNGNHVRASFGNSAMSMRSEIENGWASLRLRAGNSGMMLEEPAFDADEVSVQPAEAYA